jgi:hypothetical protein
LLVFLGIEEQDVNIIKIIRYNRYFLK